MRLRLVPQETKWDFFSRPTLWLGISGVLMVAALVSFFIQGLNFGIDFKGGTTIRTESAQEVVIADYRAALEPLELGDIVISLETAARQAPEHEHSLQQELLFLATHGLLHLLGWDHPDAASLAAMLARQDRLIAGTAV